jgi:MarR-like DNA-binding transcriptional regulator SgrR of sgrS sRNA
MSRRHGTIARWGRAVGTSPIATIKHEGDVVELSLRAPVDVATMLSLAPTAITRQGKPPGAKPIGTGPFRLEIIDRPNKKLVLDAFEDHFAGRTYLDRVTLRWFDKSDLEAKRFETDDAQLSSRGVAAFTGSQPKYKANAVDGPKALLVYVGFGKKHADVLREPAFRRALDFALDRNALISVNRGEAVIAAGEPIPIEAGATVPSPQIRNGDLAIAKAALAAAARRVPALVPTSASQLTLEISFEDTRPDDREIAERVGRALGKLGIGATLSGVSASELRDRVARGNTDLHIGQLAVPMRVDWAWWSAAFRRWRRLGRESAGGQDADDGRRAKQFAAATILPLMFRGSGCGIAPDLRACASTAPPAMSRGSVRVRRAGETELTMTRAGQQ